MAKFFMNLSKMELRVLLMVSISLLLLKNLETGTIRIGASTTITKYFLLPFIEKFHNQFPNIDISITNSLTNRLIADLKKGSLDLLVVNLPTQNDDTLIITPCATLQDCFAGNLSYKKKILKEISLEDLVTNFPIITQKEPSNTRAFLNSLMEKNNISFHPKFDIVSYALVKDFAKIGMGISYITKEFAKDELANELLFEIPITIFIACIYNDISVINSVPPTVYNSISEVQNIRILLFHYIRYQS